MPAAELTPASFFASRSGVCVYVTVRRRTFRVQFTDIDARGVVTEGEPKAAEEALQIARRALRQHQEALAPLFAKVARSST